MLNTPITPPRVPLIDPRTNLIDRAWYMFFVSLFNAATVIYTAVDDVAPNADSLIASYDAALQALAQQVDTQPVAADMMVELQKQLDALTSVPPQQLGTLSAINIDWVPYLGFDTPPPWIGSNAGQFWYDPTTGSFNAKMGNNNITQQVGEELFIYGKASAAITEGQLICKTGTVGASGVITFGPSPTGLTSNDGIIGVATENIALNGFGRITSFGVVHGINTTGASVGETWADNDTLYYNPSYAGGMTKVKPSAPYTKFEVGTVINAGSGGSGSIQVDLIHGSTLGGTDSNVQFGTLANGNIIQYDSTAGYWKNVTLSAAGIVTSVAGTAPVVSSGGTTPAISLASGYGDTQNPYASKTANYVLAAPNGSAGVPTFRALVAADIPALPYGTGTVTSVSVVSANGFAGTVATATTTPAITLSTSITGLLYGNGTALAAATISAPLAYSAGTLSITQATTSTNGYLSSTDWNTFNNKQTTSAPVTYTANFSVAATDAWIINNKSGSSCTATLPAASSYSGRVLHFQNYQAQTLISASSNVVPLAGGAAGTSILLASAGDSATLVSDGSNWLMTQYVPNNILLLE